MLTQHDNDLDDAWLEDLEYDMTPSLAEKFLTSGEGEDAVVEARTLPDDGEARQTLLARRLVEWNNVAKYEEESDARDLAAELKGMTWAEAEALVREAAEFMGTADEVDNEDIEEFAARDPAGFQIFLRPLAERLVARATDRYTRDCEARGLIPGEPHRLMSRATLDRPGGTWVVSLVDGKLNLLVTYHAGDAEWTLTEVVEPREQATEVLV